MKVDLLTARKQELKNVSLRFQKRYSSLDRVLRWHYAYLLSNEIDLANIAYSICLFKYYINQIEILLDLEKKFVPKKQNNVELQTRKSVV